MRPVRHIAAAAIVCLAGCGGSTATSGADDGGNSVTPVGVFTGVDTTDAKGDTFVSSIDDEAFIQRARSVLVTKCMKRHGFEYTAAPATTGGVGAFGVMLSPSRLRSVGYGLDLKLFAATGRLDSTDGDANSAYLGGLDASRRRAFDLAVNGDGASVATVRGPDGFESSASTTGCTAEADTRVFGSVANALSYDALPQIVRQAAPSFRDDPRLRAAAVRWMECMKRRGIAVGASISASTYLLSEAKAGRVPTASSVRKVANTDADCLESSGLWSTTESLVRDRNAAAERSMGISLLSWKAMQRSAVTQARAAISEAG